MAYCVQADVQTAAGGAKALRELADLDKNGSVDTDFITRAIAFADGVIDGVVAKRILVPIAAPVPQRIKDLAADEAVYTMKRWRSMAGQDDRDDHAERKTELEDISKGMATVGTDPQPAKSSLVVDKYSPRSNDLAVSRKNMEGFS